jgi:hypothetical protein
MNPASQKARQRFEGFHWGIPSKKTKTVKPSPAPRELVQLGTLEAITYSTSKGKEGFHHWEHEFGEDGGRKPTLAMDPDNERLHIVGGDYTVTDDGITD